MSKMMQINQTLANTRDQGTCAVLVTAYDIESLWQTKEKDRCFVRLTFGRGDNERMNVEEVEISDAEFERLSKILTADEKA